MFFVISVHIFQYIWNFLFTFTFTPENHRLETTVLGVEFGNIARMPVNYAEW